MSTHMFFYGKLTKIILQLSSNILLICSTGNHSVCFIQSIREPPHDKTNEMTCAQTDQSLRCPPEETTDPWLPIVRTPKTLIRLGRCTSWSESSVGARHFVGFVMRWLTFFMKQQMIPRHKEKKSEFYHILKFPDMIRNLDPTLISSRCIAELLSCVVSPGHTYQSLVCETAINTECL